MSPRPAAVAWPKHVRLRPHLRNARCLSKRWTTQTLNGIPPKWLLQGDARCRLGTRPLEQRTKRISAGKNSLDSLQAIDTPLPRCVVSTYPGGIAAIHSTSSHPVRRGLVRATQSVPAQPHAVGGQPASHQENISIRRRPRRQRWFRRSMGGLFLAPKDQKQVADIKDRRYSTKIRFHHVYESNPGAQMARSNSCRSVTSPVSLWTAAR